MAQDELKRHFELRNLDVDMKQAHAKASRVITKERLRHSKAEMRGLLLLLALVIVIACFIFGVF